MSELKYFVKANKNEYSPDIGRPANKLISLKMSDKLKFICIRDSHMNLLFNGPLLNQITYKRIMPVSPTFFGFVQSGNNSDALITFKNDIEDYLKLNNMFIKNIKDFLFIPVQHSFVITEDFKVSFLQSINELLRRLHEHATKLLNIIDDINFGFFFKSEDDTNERKIARILAERFNCSSAEGEILDFTIELLDNLVGILETTPIVFEKDGEFFIQTFYTHSHDYVSEDDINFVKDLLQ